MPNLWKYLTQEKMTNRETPKKWDIVKKTTPIHDFVSQFEKYINSKWRLHKWQECLSFGIQDWKPTLNREELG